MTDADELRVAGSGERWRIEGGWRAAGRQLCNDYLSYLADRRYSPASVRAYAFDLLHFTRWLAGEDIGLDAVDTDALLRYLAACRAEHREGQHDNVISLASGRASGFAPATINRRLAAISGLFSFRSMRDPGAARAPEVEVICIQPLGAPAMTHSWRQRRVVTTGPTHTIADGVAGRRPIPAVLDDLLLVADDAVLVQETSIIAGMRMLLDHAGLVVEPSAALGIAAILEDRDRFAAGT